jgi:hypothetical protein
MMEGRRAWVSLKGRSCAMCGGEAACTCFLARAALLTLWRRRLKHGVYQVLLNEP